MTALRFELPRQMVLTANQRQHWAVKARHTAELRQLGRIRAGRAEMDGYGRTTLDRAHLTVRVGWPDKRRRDVHNIAPTIKALIDGCIDAGLLPDDDDQHLVGPDLRPYVAGMRGHVVLDFDFQEVA